MSPTDVPVNNVCFRVQNLDFGTYLDLVDIYPVGRTQFKASLVVRPKKDGVKTQEWIFHSLGGGNWSAVNHGGNFYIDGTKPNGPVATFYSTHSSVPATAKLAIEQENSTNIVKIKIGDQVLRSTSGFDLQVGPDEDTDSEKWRLLEDCPILVQVGLKYRLRSLNGRVLNVDSTGKFSAQVLGDAVKVASNKLLWAIEPAADGKCTVKLVGGGTNDYLSCQSRYTNGQDNWVVYKGPEFLWDLESIGGFAYQILMHTGAVELAVTVENDQDIILKPNKVGHGQIWLVERDYNWYC